MYYVLEELKLRKLLILKGVGGFFAGKGETTTILVMFECCGIFESVSRRICDIRIEKSCITPQQVWK